eukprot:827489-Prymnesium_polylepis.1
MTPEARAQARGVDARATLERYATSVLPHLVGVALTEAASAAHVNSQSRPPPVPRTAEQLRYHARKTGVTFSQLHGAHLPRPSSSQRLATVNLSF